MWCSSCSTLPGRPTPTLRLTTAAWTAAPVVSRVIARTGPLLGVIPDDSRDIDTVGADASGRRRRAGH